MYCISFFLCRRYPCFTCIYIVVCGACISLSFARVHCFTLTKHTLSFDVCARVCILLWAHTQWQTEILSPLLYESYIFFFLLLCFFLLFPFIFASFFIILPKCFKFSLSLLSEIEFFNFLTMALTRLRFVEFFSLQILIHFTHDFNYDKKFIF